MDKMAQHLRINISLHKHELNKLDAIAEKRGESRSSMIERLIQEYEMIEKLLKKLKEGR